ncbi:hypothetical protein WH47_02077 [Habropoda laboriosa]|uniref:Uncharacterized protein n=1 Tax=Habropoda laboriosa TaxID=597456 RepID=A0A0L7QJ96_9HYME|nr:hypothetical protein WH47_02077 [Habropoda laboriosa]
MGTRLRNVRKAKKCDSVEEMKKAIMATNYHMISTDDNPQHENCPEGVGSWCKWKQAEALGTDPEAHPTPLHPDVQKEILPIYEDLSRNELLERCLGGYTQNANESFNSTVWRLAPKHLHSGLKVVEVAAYLAVSLFNEGNSALLLMMNELKILVGSRCFSYAQEMNERRVSRHNRRSALETKETRKARKEELQAQNKAYEEEEGLLYGAGIADEHVKRHAGFTCRSVHATVSRQAGPAEPLADRRARV